MSDPVTVQIIVYGAGTYWLFTGTGPTRMLAITNAVSHAEKYLDDFVIKAAYGPEQITHN